MSILAQADPGLSATNLERSALGSAAALSAFHGRSEEFIDACLVTAPLVLEPSKHVGVEANGERLLGGPIEFADNSVAPVQHFGNVREINLVIRQGSKS